MVQSEQVEQTEASLKAALRRIRPGRRTSLVDALILQRHVFESAQNCTKPIELAALARAWDVLENRKRVLRGKPDPGQLRPEAPKRHKPKPISGPTESPQ